MVIRHATSARNIVNCTKRLSPGVRGLPQLERAS